MTERHIALTPVSVKTKYSHLITFVLVQVNFCINCYFRKLLNKNGILLLGQTGDLPRQFQSWDVCL